MSFLGPAHCLDCDHALLMHVLYEFAKVTDDHNRTPIKWLATRTQLFTGKVGVECPHCGSRFLVTQWRVKLMRVALFLALCVIVFLVGKFIRALPYRVPNYVSVCVVVAFALTVVFGQNWTSARFAAVRRIRSGEIVGFPLQVAYTGATSIEVSNDDI